LVLHLERHEKVKKFKKVGRDAHGNPTLLTIAKVVGHHNKQHMMNDVLDLIYHPPSTWVTLE
jgi:hypothetical protein